MNIAFAYSNLIDSSTLSGGDWGTSLDNIRDRELASYAQSASASALDTLINIDHGSAKTARCIAVFAHNLPSTATVTVKRGTTSGGSEVYSGSALGAWPFTPIDGTYDGSHFGCFVIMGAANSARYTTIEFSSSTVVRIGRIFIGPMFVPTYNPEYGKANDGWLPDPSSVERTENGADWVTSRVRLRHQEFSFSVLSRAEASTLHDIQRTHGITGEIVYIPDGVDRSVTQQYGFLGTMRQLTALENPFFAYRALALAFDERGGAP